MLQNICTRVHEDDIYHVCYTVALNVEWDTIHTIVLGSMYIASVVSTS